MLLTTLSPAEASRGTSVIHVTPQEGPQRFKSQVMLAQPAERRNHLTVVRRGWGEAEQCLRETYICIHTYTHIHTFAKTDITYTHMQTHTHTYT